MATELGGYALTDRASLMAFRSRGDLAALFERPGARRNIYHIILLPKAHHPHLNHEAARLFADWLLGAAGQHAVATYRIQGLQAFDPEAGQSE
jgi:tungstate transport system substrate-binding protein